MINNDGYLTYQVSTPIELTANADDIEITGNGSDIILNPTVPDIEVSGFAAPSQAALQPGEVLTFHGFIKNGGAHDVLLKHRLRSAAGNQISVDGPGGEDTFLGAGAAVEYFYNGEYFCITSYIRYL